jgi:hypothetical protein
MAVRLSALRTGHCFTPQKHYFYASGTHFFQRLSKPQGLMRPEVLGKLIKIILLFGLEPATFQFVTWRLNHHDTACLVKTLIVIPAETTVARELL